MLLFRELYLPAMRKIRWRHRHGTMIKRDFFVERLNMASRRRVGLHRRKYLFRDGYGGTYRTRDRTNNRVSSFLKSQHWRRENENRP